MGFSNYELSLILILIEYKIKELTLILHNLEFDKSYMDQLEYERLSKNNNYALKATQSLKDKIKKYLEE